MQRKKLFWLETIFLLVIFSGCNSQAQDDTTQETIKIVIGSVGSDVEIWQFIADSNFSKEAGLSIEVKEISGGVQLNNAVLENQIDVNAFQSLGFLLSFNKDSSEKLVPIATTYMEPMGIYSSRYESIDELPEKALVSLPDNPANTARGLRLLEDVGLINLSENFDEGMGTPSDIVSNPKKLRFKLIESTTGPRVLEDVDLGLISNTIALEGGLNVLKDAIYKEEVKDTTQLNINVLVAKEGRENEASLRKLGDLYHRTEVETFIEEHYGGTKIAVKKEIGSLWKEVQ